MYHKAIGENILSENSIIKAVFASKRDKSTFRQNANALAKVNKTK